MQLELFEKYPNAVEQLEVLKTDLLGTIIMVVEAKMFATAAHAAIGQKRKYSGDDYIVHPQRVAAIVEKHGGTDEMIAAAWLHDTVEDTDVTPDLITRNVW